MKNYHHRVFISTIDKDGNTAGPWRLINKQKFKGLSETFQELPEKILMDKLSQCEEWERKHIFYAIMRIIKEDGDFELFSILDAFNKLNHMVKEDYPDLAKYFFEPIQEIEERSGKAGIIFTCNITFEGFLEFAQLVVIYNLTKNQAGIVYI